MGTFKTFFDPRYRPPTPVLVDSEVRGTTLQKLIVDSEVRGTTLQKLIRFANLVSPLKIPLFLTCVNVLRFANLVSPLYFPLFLTCVKVQT